MVRCRDGRANHTIPTVRGLRGKDSVDEAIKPVVLGLKEVLAGDVSIGAITIGYPHRALLEACLARLSLDDGTSLGVHRRDIGYIIGIESQTLEFGCDTSKVVGY